MIRGVERREIFRNDDDRGSFVDRFEQLVCALGYSCFALTLLANHVHAVIQTGERPLAELMHRLSFHYAQRFNRAHDRRGYLLEGRYKARLVSDEGGLRRVVAYAIGNPLRHRLVPTLDALREDRWNALSLLAGNRRPRRFESAAQLARLLGVDTHASIRFAALEPDAVDAALEPDVLAELESLIGAMCTRHGIPRERLRRREHRAVRRTLLAHAVHALGVPVAHASRAIGVSRAQAHRTLAPERTVSE